MRHPEDSFGMARHFERVLDLMEEGQDWGGYDETYRQNIQQELVQQEVEASQGENRKYI